MNHVMNLANGYVIPIYISNIIQLEQSIGFCDDHREVMYKAVKRNEKL